MPKSGAKPKAVNLALKFSVPEGSGTVTTTITPSGEIKHADLDGAPIVTTEMERTLFYKRPRKPKIQSRNKVDGGRLTIGGLEELAEYDAVFVTDANSKVIGENKITAAGFIKLRFLPEGEGVRLVSDGMFNIYEYHDVSGNPEMLNILKVSNDVLPNDGKDNALRLAFITDSELGSLDEFNSREKPIYQDHFLPDGVHLLYASSDTGREVVNQLVRLCDKGASDYLSRIENGETFNGDFRALREDTSVRYRFLYRDDLIIENPVVTGATLEGASRVAIYGKRRPSE